MRVCRARVPRVLCACSTRCADIVDTDETGAQTAATTEPAPTYDGAFVPCGCVADPRFRWVCVYSNFGGERLALEHIRALGLCAWQAKHQPGDPGHTSPLFPRYLFVQVDFGIDAWRRIYSQPGVVTILGTHHERPACMPDAAMALLFGACWSDGVIYPAAPVAIDQPALIAPGAVIALASGRYAGMEGICRHSTRRRVAMLLQVLGGEVQLSVPRGDVVVK